MKVPVSLVLQVQAGDMGIVDKREATGLLSQMFDECGGSVFKVVERLAKQTTLMSAQVGYRTLSPEEHQALRDRVLDRCEVLMEMEFQTGMEWLLVAAAFLTAAAEGGLLMEGTKQ